VAPQLNHTIVAARDPLASARFLSEVLGLAAPVPFGPFFVVETGNGVSLDYIEADGDIPTSHYAFLVSEPEFGEIFGRILDRGVAQRPSRTRSTTTTAAGAFTSSIPTTTSSRSSPGPTAADRNG
jgi:hypothetical protein